MKLVQCLGCERWVPRRASQRSIDVLGKVYSLCSAKCASKVNERYAGAIRATRAHRAEDLLRTSGFELVTSAQRRTVAAAPAAQLTLTVVNPTAPTGSPAWRKPPGRHGLNPITYCLENHALAKECRVAKCPCCEGLGVAAVCANCDGAGSLRVRTKREAELAHQPTDERCEVCRGRGWLPLTEELLERLGFRKDVQRWPAEG